MIIRRLNDDGVRQFSEFLHETRTSPVGYVPSDILTDPDYTEVVFPSINLEQQSFSNKLELARYLDEHLGENGAKQFSSDRGVWSWLSLYFFASICNRLRGGRWNPGAQERWIPAMDNWQRYYRHLLLAPWRIYRVYKDNPDIAMALLCNMPGTHGDIDEQIASHQELVTNKAAVEAATILYYDLTTQKPKVGHASKRNGDVRRYAAVLGQYDLTYDLYTMSTQQLLDLLPTEFDRFKSS